MNKIFFAKRFGFSLAEAMITLLIVCLITLASIPVLTKKKRGMSNTGHGTYMCTAVSTIVENENGELERTKVTYKQRNSNTTDEWEQVEKCAFVAPINASNFVVTLIGGGGGGGAARSQKEYVVTATSGGSGTFNPAKDAYYNFEMVSGGGGGAGASWRKRKNERAICGGAGGSGAYAEGALYLLRGTTYYYAVGTGGGSIGAGFNDHSSRAPGGGESYFRDGTNGDSIYVKLSGGQGGQNASCKRVKWNNCWGGGPGAGGSIVENKAHEPAGGKGLSYVSYINGYSGVGGAAVNDYDNSLSWYRTWTPFGGMGGWGGCHRDGDPKYPTNTRYARTFWDALNSTNVVDPDFNVNRGSETAGSGGKFDLYEIQKWHGTGGNAAEPNNVVVGTIKPNQKLTMTIGLGGATGENGGDTKLEIASLVSSAAPRVLVGKGGKGGVTDEHIEEPEYGENSGWTSKGGGKPGTCTEPSNKPYYEKVKTPYWEETDQCDPATYVCSTSVDSTGIATDEPFVMLYDEIVSSDWTSEEVKDVKDELQEAGLNYDEFFASVAADGTSVGAQYVKTSDGCFKKIDNSITYYKGCTAHLMEKKFKEENVYHSVTPALCQNAGNGDADDKDNFGAGGGGAMASETLGVYSKSGGFGANGVIIIEW